MTRHRIRTLREAIHGPSEVWLGMRMIMWSAILPALKHLVPLHVLTRWMWPRRRVTTRPERVVAITFIARRIYRVRPFLRRDNCLERSLLTYRFLAMEGMQPSLVVGARKSDEQIRGHAWVTLDGQPLMDGHQKVDQFTPITEFGAGGSRIDTSLDRSAAVG
jgi:Transglutaminase-like superfamily